MTDEQVEDVIVRTLEATPKGATHWFHARDTDKQILRCVHKNIQALEKEIRDWIAHWNEEPKPFT